MAWGKKTKTADDWKPVRIRKAWLDKLRAACKGHRHTLLFDPDTVSEPKLLEFACDVAAWVASGEFKNQLKPSMDAAVLHAATLVAAEFDSKIVTNEDGSLSVIKPGEEHTITVPRPEALEPQMPPHTVFH